MFLRRPCSFVLEDKEAEMDFGGLAAKLVDRYGSL